MATMSVNYPAVQRDITELITSKGCAPILCRLAWHDAGTYDLASQTGGPMATMRNTPISAYECNTGLNIARNLLEPIKASHPTITYADLWSLSGALAIYITSNKQVPLVWRSGRVDAPVDYVTPDGRLPDAKQTEVHIRSIFHRMGLSDKDIVVLSGAHTLGRFHKERSGFEGPWTAEPLVFDNKYFVDLIHGNWEETINAQGIMQYCDKSKGTAMAPADMCLMADPIFKPMVKKYANDEKAFFEDFAESYQKLLELGLKPETLTVVPLL